MSTQTSFDVEAIESANRHQQDMELPSGKSSNRREGGKKAAATRKANAAKKSEPETVKAGGITEEQAAQINAAIRDEIRARENFVAAEQLFADATERRESLIASITVK